MNVSPRNKKLQKIAVIGCGYIGLPTAAMLASRGLSVVGVDIDESVVAKINAGEVHIVEPDLDILVKSAVTTGRLRAEQKPPTADAFIITVPTPFKDNHTPDLSFIEAAVEAIAPMLEKDNLIILESTSPVGTTAAIAEQFARLRPDFVFPHQQTEDKPADIHLAYCPERVMPGQIIRELMDNDRVIGGMTPACTGRACELYKLFVKGECITTDVRTAEMVKLTENAFRDVNIAYANELSMICDKLDINVWHLIQLANRHPRVNILNPGPGVGGHCIAVDPWFIVHAAEEQAKLIRTAREVNNAKPYHIIAKIKKAAAFYPKPTVAYLGLTYKANTNDLRESPALLVLEELAFSTRFAVNIVEPHIDELPESLKNHPRFRLIASLEDAIKQAQIVVVMVAHTQFKAILAEDALHDKIILNVVNLNDQAVHASTTPKASPTQVSEYGLMMMNRIYGNILR